jgi:hypothetical protein
MSVELSEEWIPLVEGPLDRVDNFDEILFFLEKELEGRPKWIKRCLSVLSSQTKSFAKLTDNFEKAKQCAMSCDTRIDCVGRKSNGSNLRKVLWAKLDSRSN